NAGGVAKDLVDLIRLQHPDEMRLVVEVGEVRFGGNKLLGAVVADERSACFDRCSDRFCGVGLHRQEDLDLVVPARIRGEFVNMCSQRRKFLTHPSTVSGGWPRPARRDLRRCLSPPARASSSKWFPNSRSCGWIDVCCAQSSTSSGSSSRASGSPSATRSRG